MTTRHVDADLAGPLLEESACRDPQRLEVLHQLLETGSATEFRTLAVLGTYPCATHGAHCTLAMSAASAATLLDMLCTIEGLLELANRLQTVVEGIRTKTEPRV